MRIEITGTTLSFDVYELLSHATPEQAKDLADALSLHDDIRRNVVDSLLLGATDMQSSNTHDGLISERRRILDSLCIVRDDQISALETDLRIARERLARLEAINSRVWAVYHDSGHGHGHGHGRVVSSHELRDALTKGG